jgi:hypothetical protein
VPSPIKTVKQEDMMSYGVVAWSMEHEEVGTRPTRDGIQAVRRI